MDPTKNLGRPPAIVAALTLEGHLHEATVLHEAVVGSMSDHLLQCMAHGIPTDDLEATLRLADGEGRHLEIAAALVAMGHAA